MNFAIAELGPDVIQFAAEVRRFFTAHVTEAVRDHERRTGDGFNEALHLALGARGWLFPQWPTERGGAGLGPVHSRILDLESDRAEAPFAVQATTTMVAGAVENFAAPDLATELLPGVAAGRVRFCLGYTEPDGGSDIAAARTRAVRDGDEWLINGSKLFTTGAQHCQYVFLLTRTDPARPKHRGLTLFLVPLDSDGIDIQPIYTLGGERSNVVYYGDVRVSDRYRMGEVNDGWRVLTGPLEAEHGLGQTAPGWDDICGQGTMYLNALRRALKAAVHWAVTTVLPDGTRPADDPLVAHRLGEIALDLEAGWNTPTALGRVKSSDAIVRAAADLVDLVGPAGMLPHGTPGCVEHGIFEYTHRYAQGTGTYGGTVEVFRAMIAQQLLGLPRLELPGSRVVVS
jgi:alkylation response protein AidB-like acyl-CoA dehydrogenase